MTEKKEGQNLKNVIWCGRLLLVLLLVLVGGWITYVSFKGISIDAMISGISTRVAVLETVASTIKEDIAEIKVLMKEIREDQKKARR